MRNKSWLLTAVALSVWAPRVVRADAAADQLHGLFDEYYRWQLREHPEQAMQKGNYSTADKVTDNGLAAIERRQAETKKFLERLRAIDKAALNDADRLDYELF